MELQLCWRQAQDGHALLSPACKPQGVCFVGGRVSVCVCVWVFRTCACGRVRACVRGLFAHVTMLSYLEFFLFYCLDFQEFYHEVHRPNHFQNFGALEETEEEYTADREDMFS